MSVRQPEVSRPALRDNAAGTRDRRFDAERTVRAGRRHRWMAWPAWGALHRCAQDLSLRSRRGELRYLHTARLQRQSHAECHEHSAGQTIASLHYRWSLHQSRELPRAVSRRRPIGSRITGWGGSSGCPEGPANVIFLGVCLTATDRSPKTVSPKALLAVATLCLAP